MLEAISRQVPPAVDVAIRCENRPLHGQFMVTVRGHYLGPIQI